MGKRLECRDVVPGCDYAAWAETEDELLELVTLHARHAHEMEEIPAEVLERIRAAVRDV
ncbi:MAG: DUF1059 domain-containing protein [Gemmatimonadota bacterium]